MKFTQRALRPMGLVIATFVLASCSTTVTPRDASDSGLGDTANPDRETPDSGVAPMDASDGSVEPSDASDSGVAPDVSCAAGQQRCSGVCVDPQSDDSNCTACDNRCGPAGGVDTSCAAGRCVPENAPCPDSTRRVGRRCIADGGARPIAPISLGETSLRRPTLRVALPSGADGAVIELCSDRACTRVIETLRFTGTTARPSANLPAKSVIFWRTRARVGATEDTQWSPTWLFHTRKLDNSTGVDTSFSPHLDLNGDGFDDIAIGAPDAAGTAGANAGQVQVFYGSSTGLAMTPDRTIEGSAAGVRFGAAIGNAGDVNGDGFADMLVGAPSFGVSPNENAGQALLYLGSAMGLESTPRWTVAGSVRDARLGTSLTTAGDVDLDGYADILIGEPGATSPSMIANAGIATLHFGPVSAMSTAMQVLSGTAASSAFGVSVAHAGDLDGDGASEFVVGASGASPGGRASAGTATVFSRRGATRELRSVVLEGADADGRFGAAVSTAGDVDNDGYSDLVVGAPGAGTVDVFRGSSSGVTMTRAARARREPRDSFGASVASAHDFNDDGLDDVLVGAPNAPAQFLQNAGVSMCFVGPTIEVAASGTGVYWGSNTDVHSGAAIVGAGDLNGDARDDLVIGMPGFGNTRTGSVWIRSGGSLSTERIGPPSGSNFGAVIAR